MISLKYNKGDLLPLNNPIHHPLNASKSKVVFGTDVELIFKNGIINLYPLNKLNEGECIIFLEDIKDTPPWINRVEIHFSPKR